MRNYYPKYSELPKSVYKQVEAILGDYDRLHTMRREILFSTPEKPQTPGGGSNHSNPTAQKAIQMAYVESRIRAIDQAQAWVMEKLAGSVEPDFSPLEGFLQYAHFNGKHLRDGLDDEGPSARTWNRYRYRFAALVAKNLNLF